MYKFKSSKHTEIYSFQRKTREANEKQSKWLITSQQLQRQKQILPPHKHIIFIHKLLQWVNGPDYLIHFMGQI